MTKELEERLAALEKELRTRQISEVPKPSKKSWRKQRIGRMGSIAIVILLIAGSAIFYILLHKANPIPSNDIQAFSAISKNAGYPIYYPSYVPPKYALIPESVNLQSAFVSFQIKTDSGTVLTVTEQARPSTALELKKVSEVSSTIGKAYIATIGEQNVGFIDTKETIILISGIDQADNLTIQRMLSSFRRI